MSISAIGASSKQMRQMRNKTELQPSSNQGKCNACELLINEEKGSDEIVEEPLDTKENKMSIASLHQRVELELKEKQRKIALLRQGIIIQSPSRPRRHTCKATKEEEEPSCTSWSSWSRSHPLIVICISSMIVISMVIAIAVFIYMMRK